MSISGLSSSYFDPFRSRYQYNPDFNVTYRVGEFDPSQWRRYMDGESGATITQRVDNESGGWGYGNLGDGGEVPFAQGIRGMGDSVDAQAERDFFSNYMYASRPELFKGTLDLIRQVDPQASEDAVLAAAQKTAGMYDAPGSYMPDLRQMERVANTYLSDKLGKPVNLSDIPAFAAAMDKAEASMHNGFSLRESWPILAAPLAVWAGAVAAPYLAGAMAGGAATTASTIGAQALVQGGLGAIGSAVTGGDVLKGALTGAAGGALGAGASELAPAIQAASQAGGFIGLTAQEAEAIAKAVTAGARAAVTGADPQQAVVGALAGAGLSAVGNAFVNSPEFGRIADSVMSDSTVITPAADEAANDFQISPATDTLGQGLPADNMNDFFGGVINWDEGSDFLTGGDTTAIGTGNADGWVSGADLPQGSNVGEAGWVSGDELPSGVYNINTGQFTPTPDGMEPGSYLDLGNGQIVPTGTLSGTSFTMRPGETATQAYQRLLGGMGGLASKAWDWLSTGTSGGRSPLEMGLVATPALAAMAYARNMSGPDTSRLESIYGQMDPAAALGAFDLQTNDRRSQLETNLARRGVMGSSFANDDLTTFNTTRDVGRRNLLQGGLESQAKVATDISKLQDLGTQRKVDLYGRALNSLGLAFGGSRLMGGR